MKPVAPGQLLIEDLLGRFGTKFVIPNFQRPYVWSESKCENLWDNMLEEFALNSDVAGDFDRNERYFLGTIITYSEEDIDGCVAENVVDGHQRITTLTLLLRAIFAELPDSSSKKFSTGKCIWNFDEKDNLDKSVVKISNEMIFDAFKNSFLQILATGSPPKGATDHYAKNYHWFKRAAKNLKQVSLNHLELFASRILNNADLVRLACSNRHDGYRLFRVQNAEGEKLNVTDIFKSELCEYLLKTKGSGAETGIANHWVKLEESCEKVIKKTTANLSKLDYLFYIFARNHARNVTSSNFDNIYTKNQSAFLKDPKTLENITALLDFFCAIKGMHTRFLPSARAQRLAYILLNIDEYPAWNMLAAFLANNGETFQETDNPLLENTLTRFLACIIGATAIMKDARKTFNSIIFGMRDFILTGVINEEQKFSAAAIQNNLNNLYDKDLSDKVAKKILWWWTFKDESQPLYTAKTPTLQREHIFATALADKYTLVNSGSVNLLGNLALLESTLNHQASNYEFNIKAQYYKGTTNNPKLKPTFNLELIQLADTLQNFSEIEILSRNQKIINSILDYLDSFGLLDRDSVF